MSTSKRMKLRKRRKTKVSLSEFGVTCHTAQHCLNALSFSLYGPLSFCRQIKAKESKSNFQKSIGEKVNIPVSCTHSPINISSFTLPCLLHNINSSLRSLYYLVSSSFCRENNDNDNDRVK